MIVQSVRFRARVPSGSIDADHLTRLCEVIGSGECRSDEWRDADLAWRGGGEKRGRGGGSGEEGMRGGWGTEEERVTSGEGVEAEGGQRDEGAWVVIDEPRHLATLEFEAFQQR